MLRSPLSTAPLVSMRRGREIAPGFMTFMSCLVRVSPSDGGRVDQRERRSRVKSPPKMSRSLSDYDFECWPDVSFDQVPAVSRRISLPEHDVSVDGRAIPL